MEYVSSKKGVLTYVITKPIFHPAVDNRFGPTYGHVVGWSSDDIKTQMSLGDINALVSFNLTAAKLIFEKNFEEYKRINRLINSTHACAVCKRLERNRRKLYACDKGCVFHKKCIKGHHCPICD